MYLKNTWNMDYYSIYRTRKFLMYGVVQFDSISTRITLDTYLDYFYLLFDKITNKDYVELLCIAINHNEKNICGVL